MKAIEARKISNRASTLKRIYELVEESAEEGRFYVTLKCNEFPELGDGYECNNLTLNKLEKQGYTIVVELRGRPLKTYGFLIKWDGEKQ